MGKAPFSTVDIKRFAKAAKDIGLPVERMSLVVGVHGMGLLQPGESADSLLGLEDGVKGWDKAIRRAQ